MRNVTVWATGLILFMATVPMLHSAASVCSDAAAVASYKNALHNQLMNVTTTEALGQQAIHTYRQKISEQLVEILCTLKNEPRREVFIANFIQKLIQEAPDREAQAVAGVQVRSRTGYLCQAQSLAEAKLLAGNMYHKGLKEVPRNDMKALELYNEVAEDKSVPMEIRYQARREVDGIALPNFASFSASYSLSVALPIPEVKTMLEQAITYYIGAVGMPIDYQKALALLSEIVADPRARSVDRARAAYIAGMIRYRGGYGIRPDYVDTIRWFGKVRASLRLLPTQIDAFITIVQKDVILKLQREEFVRQYATRIDACAVPQVLADPLVISHFVTLLGQEILGEQAMPVSTSDILLVQIMKQYINSKVPSSLVQAKLLAGDFLLQNIIPKRPVKAFALYSDVAQDLSTSFASEAQARLDNFSTLTIPTNTSVSTDSSSSSSSTDQGFDFGDVIVRSDDYYTIVPSESSSSSSSSSSAKRSEPFGGRGGEQEDAQRRRQ